MSATPHLETITDREDWYIRTNHDHHQTESIFEEDLELLRKKKKERVSRILSSFFGVSITVILMILLYYYLRFTINF